MKILLLGKKSFLVDSEQKKFSCQFGEINLSKTRIGRRIKSSLGYEFTVAEPTIIDMLKKCRRGPQIIMPKDAAQVVAVTGASNGWKCLDAGSGSGFLSIFLGNVVKPSGSVVTYEKNEEFAKNVEKNIKFCNLEKTVKLKNKPAEKFTEKNLNLITLDMKNAEKMVKKCHAALKPGGWLCIYSPHIEQQIRARNEMENFFVHIKTIENIQREWTSLKGFTHPRPSQVVHTGFLTFGRKI